MAVESWWRAGRRSEQADAWVHLFQAVPYLVLWCDANGKVLRQNPVSQKLLGMIQDLTQATLPADKEELLSKLRQALADGEGEGTLTLLLSDGVTLTAQWSLMMIGEALDQTVQIIVNPQWSDDVDSELIAACEQLGVLITKQGTQLRRAHQQLRVELLERSKLEDRTRQQAEDLKESQSQLVQADKLAQLGKLTAGITHEINSPLAFFRSNIESLDETISILVDLLEAYRKHSEKIPDLDGVRDREREEDVDFLIADSSQAIDDCREGARRLEELVRSLQDFSRRDETEWDIIDIHEAIDFSLRMIQKQLGSDCDIHKDYGQVPLLYGHATQLSQVFLNLFSNALQAMDGSGTLTIQTHMQESSVVITVSDTGPGMSQEILSRVFTPFVTSKPAGKGTGLGLFVSKQIVEKHGGEIEVTSQEGKGCRFSISLPVRKAST